MTDLQKLHAFCTRLDHYPSRLAIQEEIERLLAEEAKSTYPPSLRDDLLTWCYEIENADSAGPWAAAHVRQILSRHEQEDPLAVLADRKGLRVQCFPLAGPQGQGLWTIALYHGTDTVYKIQRRPYAEAEAEIRNALSGFQNREVRP